MASRARSARVVTALARRLSSLSAPAHAAVWIYTEVATEHADDPTFGPETHLGLLLGALRAADGVWADLQQLIDLHDEQLDEFLNPWHARTAWAAIGGHVPPLGKETAA